MIQKMFTRQKAISKMVACLAISIILAGVILSSGCVAPEGHKPITQELINLVEKNPEIESMLKASIAEAKKINPDPKTNPVQSLSDYYNYIDRASERIPGQVQVIEIPSALTLRDQLTQDLDYFWFLVAQPLPELEGQGLFENSLQYYEPFAPWLCKFVNTWGVFLDTEESWNEETYQEFYDDPSFGLQKGWYESPSNWNTFNRFFSRYLKSPDMRPIASPGDPAVVVSPGDCVPIGVWRIDENSDIRVLEVKSVRYYNHSINDLLGEDSQYKDAFANGMLTHAFLDVNDYHRYHFAVGGTIKEKEIISQKVIAEVTWDPEQGEYVCICTTGWQFFHTRGYVIVDTGEYGLVALMPVGMSEVSSVNFEDNVEVGTTHKKGDMLGYYLFGGSDFIMIFQEKARFEMTAMSDIHILMGEKYGVMKGAA